MAAPTDVTRDDIETLAAAAYNVWMTLDDLTSSDSAAMQAFREGLAATLRQITTEKVTSAKIEALREIAEEITAQSLTTRPCKDPEPCCGSAATCDAVQPLPRLVGARWLRERAHQIEQAAP